MNDTATDLTATGGAPRDGAPVDGVPAPPAVAGRAPLRAGWFAFDALSLARLYAVLKLRVDVFIVEQVCPYPEIDGQDAEARHFLVESEDGDLAAYLRLFAPADARAAGRAARLGRIVTAPAWRGCGLGDYLMRAGLATCARLFPDHDVELAAQAHLQGFYEAHGFHCVSDIYPEDGIPHVDMRRPAGT
ncbi:GNAT family N-acetyltransferase [Stappia sp.]|uniref:GNAT family N-acetyltransferase n=1 Tax=Stappia sp. TaxID=1870903 RepID=UPI0032D902A9